MSRVDVLDFVKIGAVLISVICGSLVILYPIPESVTLALSRSWRVW